MLVLLVCVLTLVAGSNPDRLHVKTIYAIDQFCKLTTYVFCFSQYSKTGIAKAVLMDGAYKRTIAANRKE